MSAALVVVGMGYVGLPLAQAAVRAGLSVVGLDMSPKVVDGLNGGVSHVDDIPDTEIQEMLDLGFKATRNAAVLAGADTAVVCVPTPLSANGTPDLSAVESAIGDIAAHLHDGMLVVLESTTYPGTTHDVVRPALERGGQRAGIDFHLAFSPERVDPGNRVWRVANTPKVVGGLTPTCLQRATDFYAQFVDTVVPAAGLREAEMAKLLENTFRHVNIALVNEMARFSHDLEIDFWDVIRCASTKPFGFMPFFPGPGVGGHCIPIDPNYLSFRVRSELGYQFRFVELAQDINAGMPDYVARRAQDLLNRARKPVNGARILLMGVTYKPDIADQRESPAVPLATRLHDLGATVLYHDPFVPIWSLPWASQACVPDLDAATRDADLVILLQSHTDYGSWDPDSFDRPILDTRGMLRGANVTRL